MLIDTCNGPLMTITDLKQGVKNPNRVNIFVDNKYAFSLDVAQIIDFKVKIGQKLTEERLNKLREASEFGKLYQRTLEWVLVRPRSEKEVRDYVSKKLKTSFSGLLLAERDDLSKSTSEVLETIIIRLKERKYLDDFKFAEWYVENRFIKKGISRKRLKMELTKKGVGGEAIDQVLETRNDEEEIKKIIAKKRAKYNDDKLIQYLCRQGFDYQLAQNLVLEKD